MKFNFDSPSPFDINITTKKAKFFLGDRWIDIGGIETSLSRNGNVFDIEVPDIDAFLLKREGLNDGTNDWLEWGPRMN